MYAIIFFKLRPRRLKKRGYEPLCFNDARTRVMFGKIIKHRGTEGTEISQRGLEIPVAQDRS
jgi:hypothetical protein